MQPVDLPSIIQQCVCVASRSVPYHRRIIGHSHRPANSMTHSINLVVAPRLTEHCTAWQPPATNRIVPDTAATAAVEKTTTSQLNT